MKQGIDWHRECLVNSTHNVKCRREQAERENAIIERLELSNRFLQAQIDLAIIENKDGFDREKYAIKRLPVINNEL